MHGLPAFLFFSGSPGQKDRGFSVSAFTTVHAAWTALSLSLKATAMGTYWFSCLSSLFLGSW